MKPDITLRASTHPKASATEPSPGIAERGIRTELNVLGVPSSYHKRVTIYARDDEWLAASTPGGGLRQGMELLCEPDIWHNAERVVIVATSTGKGRPISKVTLRRTGEWSFFSTLEIIKPTPR